jgi:hypothetical protein
VNNDVEVCMAKNEVKDCGQYLDSGSCGSGVVKDGNVSRACRWGETSCVPYICEDYTAGNACRANELNVKNNCFWNSSSSDSGSFCKNVDAVTSCDAIDNEWSCDSGTVRPGCFWNYEGASGTYLCRDVTSITSCAEISVASMCRVTDSSGAFPSLPDTCAWVKTENVEKCVVSTTVENCSAFVSATDCDGRRSYPGGGSASVGMIYICMLYY